MIGVTHFHHGPVFPHTLILNSKECHTTMQSYYLCTVSGARCQVHGVRCTVSGARCQVHGVRCMVSGARCQVHSVRDHRSYIFGLETLHSCAIYGMSYLRYDISKDLGEDANCT